MKMYEETADWVLRMGSPIVLGMTLKKPRRSLFAHPIFEKPGITNFMTTHSEEVAGFFGRMGWFA